MSVITEHKSKCANGYKVMCESYNSAAEVVRDCKERPFIGGRGFDDMGDGHLGYHTPGWCGVQSYEEALQYLEQGYQPVVEQLKTKIKANLQGEAKRISFHNDVVGYAPIVPLAIMGVPNSMLNSYMKPIKAKVVDVYYDGTFRGMTSSDDIIATGAKVISVILKMEQQGYRFNLYQVQGYSDETGTNLMKVKLKDAAQPIDLKRISFPMTHTAFFRVIGFDWYSKTPRGRYISGYGKALSDIGKTKGKLGELFREMFGKNAVYVSGNELKYKGEGGEQYLTEVFTQCGKNIKA